MVSDPVPTPQRPQLLLIVSGVLAALGAAMSVHLTQVHYWLYTDPGYAPGCDFNQTVSCSFVEMSPYAMFLGVPVSMWGLLGYLVLLGVVISGWRARAGSRWPVGALLGIGALFTLVSVYNASISVFVLEKLCPWCMGTYAVNLLLFVIAAIAARRHARGLVGSVVDDLRALRARPLVTAAAAVTFALASVLLVALYPTYWQDPAGGQTGAGSLRTGRLDDGAHWIGSANPAVTIVEFSDYECPYCARSHDVVRQAVAAQPDRLRLVHRHYPLDMACNDELDRPFHRYACLAATAAECAGEQGKFWDMNDRLFGQQKALGEASVDRLVDALGLDRGRFEACVRGETVRSHLQADIDRAVELRATGTPFYVVNGVLHKGAMTPERLAQMVAASGFGASPVAPSAP